MAKRRVLLWGQFKDRFVKIEENSTEGATIGTDVYNEDGTLFDPETVITEIVNESAPSTPSYGSIASTLWRLILEIPSRIKDIENMVKPGYVYHDGTAMVPYEWPTHDTRIESDENIVIQSNKQYLIWHSVAIEGTLEIEPNGMLVILDDGLPEPTGPDMSYDVDGNLTQIDYDGSQQKILSYDVSGDLVRVDYTEDGVTLRKDLVYSGGTLDYIDEYYI